VNVELMDLRTKVGQLFTFSAFGPTLDADTRRMITELKAGGLFLPTGGLQEPEQVHRLTKEMQQTSLENGSGLPLFITADFVAGAGCKLRSGAVHFPKNRAIGAGGDERLAYESGKITAEESLAMGVNFNYSPVVDINNNPHNPVIGMHSFGEDKETVSTLANAVIRGYQEHGMIATAKHFPGHGDTSVDSHEDLPVLPFDRERLDSFELVPFKEAISAGVDAIMVGHIAVPALDPTLTPASLSYELVTKLLREELQFKGLIVTDGLSMKGVMNKYSMEEACVLSLLAGTDILLATTSSYEESASVLEAVIAAVESGRISEARIDESVKRIMEMKKKYGLLPEAFQQLGYNESNFNKPSSIEADKALAWSAATPINGLTEGALSQHGGQKWLVLYDKGSSGFAEAILRMEGMQGQETDTYEGLLQLVADAPAGSNIIMASSHNKRIDTSYLKQLDEKLALFENAVWVHFGSKYDMDHVSAKGLLLYDRAPSLQAAAVNYLIGSNGGEQ